MVYLYWYLAVLEPHEAAFHDQVVVELTVFAETVGVDGGFIGVASKFAVQLVFAVIVIVSGFVVEPLQTPVPLQFAKR
jgi:hypothetical protein